MAIADSYELTRGAILRREQIVATYGGHVRERHTSADYAGPGTCIDEVDVEIGR